MAIESEISFSAKIGFKHSLLKISLESILLIEVCKLFEIVNMNIPNRNTNFNDNILLTLPFIKMNLSQNNYTIFFQISLLKFNMNIIISGSTGFIGKYISKELTNAAYTVKSIPKNILYNNEKELQNLIDWADVVINLAGAPILKRWTKKYQKVLIDSRIKTTQNIVNCINKSNISNKILINTSAIGIYKSNISNDEESKTFSDDFLGKLCKQWETTAFQSENNCKVIIIRLGIVLGKDGGALQNMLFPFKLGIGGRIGTGKQYFPWIHINDLFRIIEFTLKNEQIKGVVNVVAPEIITNHQFTKALGKSLQKPTVMIIPKLILHLLYGKASAILLESKIVQPKKLLDIGFEYKYPTINEALGEILKKSKKK